MSNRGAGLRAYVKILLPIGLGGLIYVLFRGDTILINRLLLHSPIGGELAQLRESLLWIQVVTPEWMIYSLPAALWMLSLLLYLLWVWRERRGAAFLAWFLLVVAIALGAEMGQTTSIVPGTFSAGDLVAYSIVALTAYWSTSWTSATC